MLLHASAVAFDDTAAILITGDSGSGKSSLCAELIALGASLIGDDQLRLTTSDAHLMAAPAPELVGLLELYGIGIVQLAPHRTMPQARLLFEVHLLASHAPMPRLPIAQCSQYLGVSLPRFDLPAQSASIAAKIALLTQVFQQFGRSGLVDVAKPCTKG